MKEQKSTRLTAEWAYLVVALIVAVLIIALATSVRVSKGNFFPIGYDSYHNIRISNEILNKGSLVQFDFLSNGGRSVGYFLGWPILLVLSAKLFGGKDTLFASRFLPLVFSLLSLIVLYFIIKKVFAAKNQRIIFLFLLALSPPFIYMSIINSYYSICMLLGLLSFYLFMKNKVWATVLSVIFFSLISLFNFYAFLVSLVIFTLYIVLKDQKSLGRFLWVFACSIATFIIYFDLWLSRFMPVWNLFILHTPDGTRFYGIDSVSHFIVEFGGEFGLGFFISLIALFGIFLLWEKKYKYAFSYVIIFILFLLSFYFEFALFYLSLFLIFLATMGLSILISRKFESQTIKYLILLILSCGVIFDGISYANSYSDLSPTIREAEMMSFIRDRTLSNGVVFAYFKNGDWISYAGKINVIDSSLLYTKDYYPRWVDSNTIFHPTNVIELKSLLDKYRVDYIWIDKKSQKTIYSKDNLKSDELSLLIYTLKNDRAFNLVFRNFEVELYRYNRNQ